MSQFILQRARKTILHFNTVYLNYTCNFHHSKDETQYYLVTKGRNPGLYNSWKECEDEVTCYPKPEFKKFKRKEDVLNHLQRIILDIRQNPPQTSDRIDALERILDEYQQKWRISLDVPSVNDLSKCSKENCTDDCIKLKGLVSRVEQPNNGLTVDDDGYLVIYTDGACSNNGRSDAVGAIGVYFGPDNPLNSSMLLEGKSTNNRAEIKAAVSGLEKAHLAGFKKVKLMTDSEFVIRCSTLWSKKWKKNGWKKLNGNRVANRDELIELDEASQRLDVKWVHVPGHQGVEGNEGADKLARECIQEWKRSQQ